MVKMRRRGEERRGEKSRRNEHTEPTIHIGVRK
jgi:hypothetical protein